MYDRRREKVLEQLEEIAEEMVAKREAMEEVVRETEEKYLREVGVMAWEKIDDIVAELLALEKLTGEENQVEIAAALMDQADGSTTASAKKMGPYQDAGKAFQRIAGMDWPSYKKRREQG